MNQPNKEVGPALESYQRDDGSWVCHIETSGMAENENGPMLTVYINDDTDAPVFDNQ
jgi:hypothetical protein